MNVYEMEGFLRGKCMPRDILVNESTAAYLVRKLNESAILKADRDALAVENAALKRERSELSAIGELIRTQDNRITDQPFFAVMTKREIVGSEDHDCDRICWVENQSGDYVEATETQHRRLEAIYQAKYEVRDGWDRYAMKEIDVFVTGCFTEQGCKDYINKNGHNLNKPFIYAFGSYRNDEYQTVRKFIMQVPETPDTDAALAAIEARVWAEAKDFAKSMLASDSADHIDFLFDGKIQQLREAK